jgi:septum formation protein
MAPSGVESRPVLVLASGSPRRRELLTSIGVPTRILPVDVDETPRPGEDSEQLVVRLAGAKAEAGYRRWSVDDRSAPDANSGRRCLVIGADTVVDLDGTIMGKPTDDDDVADTLRRLAGRTHQVYTGVSVVGAVGTATTASINGHGSEIVDGKDGPDTDRRATVVRTDVTFRPLADDEIAWYVSTGEGRDKAGSYGIQGLGSLLVMCVEGSYPNVVGLPLVAVDRLLGCFAWSLRDFTCTTMTRTPGMSR